MRPQDKPLSERVRFRRESIIRFCREAGKVLTAYEVIERLHRENQRWGFTTVWKDLKVLGLTNHDGESYPFQGA